MNWIVSRPKPRVKPRIIDPTKPMTFAQAKRFCKHDRSFWVLGEKGRLRAPQSDQEWRWAFRREGVTRLRRIPKLE